MGPPLSAGPGRFIRTHWGLGLWGLIAAVTAAADPPPPAPGPVSDPAPVSAQASAPLTDLLLRTETADRLAEAVRLDLANGRGLVGEGPTLAEIERSLPPGLGEETAGGPAEAEAMGLYDLERLVESANTRLTALVAALSGQAARLEGDLDRLAQEARVWHAAADLVPARDK